MISVDVLTVLGPGRAILEPVLSALDNQGDVELHHHVIDSPSPLPGESRIGTIARARNLAKTEGKEHYVMFLDDDVMLPPLGIQRLVYAFIFNRSHAAIGIDYQNYTQPFP